MFFEITKEKEVGLDFLLLQYGIEENEFYPVIEHLMKLWMSESSPISDSEGKRFVQSYLLDDLCNPLKMGIIADNLTLFQKYSMVESNKIDLFDICCVCGCEKILRALLQESVWKCCLTNSEEAIPFLLSSKKYELALEIAKCAKDLGKQKPGFLYFYGSNSLESLKYIKAIEEIFRPERKLDTKKLTISEKKEIYRKERNLEKSREINIPTKK